MTKARKQLEAFTNAPQNVRWSRLGALLERNGFVVQQCAGKPSHWIVYHPDLDEPQLTVALKDGELKIPRYRSELRSLVLLFLEEAKEG